VIPLSPHELAVLEAFLAELDGALEPVALGGLAICDPELPGDLRALAARADALGLHGLEPTLVAFASAMGAVTDRSLDRRRAAWRDAFEAWQRVLFWRSHFGAEVDLLRAGARLYDTPPT